MSTVSDWARRCGGETVNRVSFCMPGPGHGPRDRSLSVKLSGYAPDGFIVHSFAGNDPMTCRDHVRACLGLPMFDRPRSRSEILKRGERKQDQPPPDRSAAAGRMWRQTTAINGTLGERYFREGRKIRCPLSPTMRFLPARGQYPAAVVTAFAIPGELEPGVMSVADLNVRAVHRILLDRDGRKLDKKFLGSPGGQPLVVAPFDELGRGLVIAEGIEDALRGHEATGLAAWAGGSASPMATLASAVPRHVETVLILQDDNEAGRNATRTLADEFVASRS